LDEHALYAVEYARNLGASYAEARYHRRELRSISMRGDRIIGFSTRVSEGYRV